MELSDRFLNLVKQQLSSYEAEAAIKHLVVYVAQSGDSEEPTLEQVDQWPVLGKALPPVETDPDLRTPSADRRWYPLQEGSILLGVLRAEREPSEQMWPEALDKRLQATAGALGQCLGLELDRTRLLDDIGRQREQLDLMLHQLRNPLAALRTYAQLLLRRLGPESNHRMLVEGLLTEQAQLSQYVSAIDQLGQSKLSAQVVSSAPLLLPPVLPKTSAITLRTLLDPLIDRAVATANLQSRKWYGPSHWPAWTNSQRPLGDGVIAEIVANLLENAFRYSIPPTAIGLELNDQAICVWDGGIPIPFEEYENIFQKGFRGKSSSAKPGSGFGLFLGRQLAEQIGGELKLISSPSVFDPQLPDKGNAFLLKLYEK